MQPRSNWISTVKKLEQYFKDKEKDLADQQLESDRTLAELLKEKD